MARRVTRLDIRQAGRPILIALAVLVALNVGFYVVLAQPAVREYRQLSERGEAFRRLAERTEEVDGHERFLEDVQQAEQDLESLQKEILATRNERLVDVHEELAMICAKFGIDLDTVGFSGELLLDEELDRLSMNVPLEGNYASLRKFLQAVEKSDKFLVVEGVSLAVGKEGGSLLSLNINIATYFTAPAEMIERNRAPRRSRRG